MTDSGINFCGEHDGAWAQFFWGHLGWLFGYFCKKRLIFLKSSKINSRLWKWHHLVRNIWLLLRKTNFSKKYTIYGCFLANFWLILAIFREFHQIWRINIGATVLISSDAQYTTFIQKKHFQVKKWKSGCFRRIFGK